MIKRFRLPSTSAKLTANEQILMKTLDQQKMTILQLKTRIEQLETEIEYLKTKTGKIDS